MEKLQKVGLPPNEVKKMYFSISLMEKLVKKFQIAMKSNINCIPMSYHFFCLEMHSIWLILIKSIQNMHITNLNVAIKKIVHSYEIPK